MTSPLNFLLSEISTYNIYDVLSQENYPFVWIFEKVKNHHREWMVVVIIIKIKSRLCRIVNHESFKPPLLKVGVRRDNPVRPGSMNQAYHSGLNIKLPFTA